MSKTLRYFLVGLMLPAFTYADDGVAALAENTPSLFSRVENFFGTYLVEPMGRVLFFDVAFFTDAVNLPFIVFWLVAGAVFLTFRMAFINFRGFTHAIAVTWGKYDNPKEIGDVTHFQALSSALSATIGLGNIAGVAMAVGLGGPGAVVWMVVAGLFGMTSKFTECTLGQMYRKIDAAGKISGGPMHYLADGFAEKGMPRLGKSLAALFAVMCIGGSFGGGNMFQANQAFAAISRAFPDVALFDWAFGLIFSALVGIVIIGGILRIAAAAEIIVPFMCTLYVLACLYILFVHRAQVPAAFGVMFASAFSLEAGFGGLIGVLVVGFQRAAFSNEAGIGSSAIAHSAAATMEPVREGIVSLLEPFIDTIIVCTMTGLVMVVTGVYKGGHGEGVHMAAAAFESVVWWFPYVLTLAVVLFAFSTMISWSYYGERCWAYLFGLKTTIVYRVLFCLFAFLGSVFSLGRVLEFSDLMILGMAFPNMLGVLLLSKKVRVHLDDYWLRYKSGLMPVYDSNGLEQTPSPTKTVTE